MSCAVICQHCHRVQDVAATGNALLPTSASTSPHHCWATCFHRVLVTLCMHCLAGSLTLAPSIETRAGAPKHAPLQHQCRQLPAPFEQAPVQVSAWHTQANSRTHSAHIQFLFNILRARQPSPYPLLLPGISISYFNLLRWLVLKGRRGWSLVIVIPPLCRRGCTRCRGTPCRRRHRGRGSTASCCCAIGGCTCRSCRWSGRGLSGCSVCCY
jgi:hypothetical protein